MLIAPIVYIDYAPLSKQCRQEVDVETDEYFERGIKRLQDYDYEGAVTDYTKTVQ